MEWGVVAAVVVEYFVEYLDNIGPEHGHPRELLDNAEEKYNEEGLVNLRVLGQLPQATGHRRGVATPTVKK